MSLSETEEAWAPQEAGGAEFGSTGRRGNGFCELPRAGSWRWFAFERVTRGRDAGFYGWKTRNGALDSWRLNLRATIFAAR